MAKVYAIAIRMRCSECGETNATGLAWARHQQAFACPSCGATIDPKSVEIRREVARVEREWTALWEDLRRQTEPYC